MDWRAGRAMTTTTTQSVGSRYKVIVLESLEYFPIIAKFKANQLKTPNALSARNCNAECRGVVGDEMTAQSLKLPKTKHEIQLGNCLRSTG